MDSTLASLLPQSAAVALLAGTFSLSALSKFVSEEHRRLFPTLPPWFWSAAGAWELGMTVLLLRGDHSIAVPMSYTYLGGALSAGLLLAPGWQKLPLTLFPSALILVTSSLAAHAKIDITRYMPVCCASGFAIGSFFAYSGRSSSKSD